MQSYVKIYLYFFRLTRADWFPSELSNQTAVDIHHIHRRGAGGAENEDRIENLIALTREEHNKYGDKKCYKSFLYEKHMLFLEAFGKDYDREWLKDQIAKYVPFKIAA